MYGKKCIFTRASWKFLRKHFLIGHADLLKPRVFTEPTDEIFVGKVSEVQDGIPSQNLKGKKSKREIGHGQSDRPLIYPIIANNQ